MPTFLSSSLTLNLKWGAIVLNCLCRDKANFGAAASAGEGMRESKRQRIQRRTESEHFLAAKTHFSSFRITKAAAEAAEAAARVDEFMAKKLACPTACFTSRACQLELASERQACNAMR